MNKVKIPNLYALREQLQEFADWVNSTGMPHNSWEYQRVMKQTNKTLTIVSHLVDVQFSALQEKKMPLGEITIAQMEYILKHPKAKILYSKSELDFMKSFIELGETQRKLGEM